MKRFQRDPTQMFLILATGALITMTGGVVAPVLPQVITTLEFDRAFATHLVSIHALTIALFSPLLGFVADQISPVRVLIPALILYGVFGIIPALASNFWLLLVSRALLGATAGGIAAGSLGLLGKLYDKETRAQVIAYSTAVLTVTGIIFPLLGGGVGSIHWRYSFALYAIAFPLAVMSYYAFPEFQLQSQEENNSGLSVELKKVLSRPVVIELLLFVALTAAIMYSVVIYAPLYLQETLGLGTVPNGILLATRALGATLISVFGSKQLAKRWSYGSAIALGFTLMGLSLFSIPFLQQFPLLLLSAMLFGVGFGLVLPNLYSDLSNIAPQSVRSSVLAIAIGTSFLGQFLSPVFLSPVLEVGGFTGVFNTAAVVAWGSGIFLWQRMP
ncbi:major facilitator superfamily MFS_1 [Halothece sp. PCC 7418]|uniref:MFS transporter n=1 Tax=Halothece sp. (strain PCC 7418) TaxID=65093 RepID=UPI0002A05E2E|nr:MFS transporter [Halothece sp. PCC 7418]AFZ42455.1 major facilitator superfamily MFS_1 [Halothece sp. PCC 7418]